MVRIFCVGGQGSFTVVVTSMAPEWRIALDKALVRAARFLMRQWRRGNDTRRLRQRAIPLDR